MRGFISRTDVAPYSRDFFLSVAGTTLGAVGALRRHHGLAIEDPHSKLAVTYMGETWAAVVLSEEGCAHDVVAHEVFHATHALMASTGDKFGAKHHEPYAYLCGWLTAWVYGELRKRRVRVK
jgi:hypothetical protein